jgi:hypothetical protein
VRTARGILFLGVAAMAVFLAWRMRAAPAPGVMKITQPAELKARVPRKLQEALRASARVEAVLVDGQMSDDPSVRRFREYPIRSALVALSDDQARTLKGLLLDPRNYDGPYTCEFFPNVGYRLITASDTVYALVCHSCDEVPLFYKGEWGGGYMTPIGPRLEELSHSLFPTDSVITAVWRKGLQDRRGAP